MTLGRTIFARGDGGFGGPTGPTPAVHKIPDSAPDIRHVIETRADQALLYRLNGDHDPTMIASFDVRFTSPAYPGETIATEIWVDGDVVSFRGQVIERGVIAINNGRCLLRRKRS